jgi:hypothetical protein
MAIVLASIVGLGWVYQKTKISALVHHAIAESDKETVQVTHRLEIGDKIELEDRIVRRQENVNMPFKLFLMRTAQSIYNDVSENEVLENE